jgi:hypothetical protein
MSGDQAGGEDEEGEKTPFLLLNWMRCCKTIAMTSREFYKPSERKRWRFPRRNMNKAGEFSGCERRKTCSEFSIRPYVRWRWFLVVKLNIKKFAAKNLT